jgi:hypothetical protein
VNGGNVDNLIVEDGSPYAYDTIYSLLDFETTINRVFH